MYLSKSAPRPFFCVPIEEKGTHPHPPSPSPFQVASSEATSAEQAWRRRQVTFVCLVARDTVPVALAQHSVSFALALIILSLSRNLHYRSYPACRQRPRCILADEQRGAPSNLNRDLFLLFFSLIASSSNPCVECTSYCKSS